MPIASGVNWLEEWRWTAAGDDIFCVMVEEEEEEEREEEKEQPTPLQSLWISPSISVCVAMRAASASESGTSACCIRVAIDNDAAKLENGCQKGSGKRRAQGVLSRALAFQSNGRHFARCSGRAATGLKGGADPVGRDICDGGGWRQ